jgi:hypothetical protein
MLIWGELVNKVVMLLANSYWALENFNLTFIRSDYPS